MEGVKRERKCVPVYGFFEKEEEEGADGMLVAGTLVMRLSMLLWGMYVSLSYIQYLCFRAYRPGCACHCLLLFCWFVELVFGWLVTEHRCEGAWLVSKEVSVYGCDVKEHERTFSLPFCGHQYTLRPTGRVPR